MDLFLAISQGTGLALATGLRPFLPPLLAGLLARGDLGLDFDGSDYAFLESVPFLGAVLLITVAATAWPLRRSARSTGLFLAAVAIVLASLEFGGSLAGEDYAAAPGLVAGAVCGLVGQLAALTFLGRAETRLAARGEESSARFLGVYADGAALVLAALAIFLPPLSFLALAFCLVVLVERRRRAERKYEGLRVLR